MDGIFFAGHQIKVFSEDLLRAFLEAGFEIVEEPYIDYTLCGFRATYLRRYLLHQPSPLFDGILTTIIHVVGLPFGHNGQKMIILTTPRNTRNEPLSEALKLRIKFDDEFKPHVVHGEARSQSTTTAPTTNGTNRSEEKQAAPYEEEYPFVVVNDYYSGWSEKMFYGNLSNQQDTECYRGNRDDHYASDLSNYVAHLIEIISPGLIELPLDMKLEVLKKLSIESIIKMSQVNSEFRTLIFKRGESLWRHLCYRDFKLRVINRLVHKSWMELYRDTYIVKQAAVCRKERALPGPPDRPALPPAPAMLRIQYINQWENGL